ncbi:hypothetical protein AA23498_3434 [Acetobacter nitrogenifigens DSM 23921 = NBRC 105050]|uniref:Uncharacterized protein n=2 Tax=Acetobacter TaxID=434 RepID=A0A511XEY3_9PROT|nr:MULTISPECIES: hypothetical protein [Acetobacter]MBO1361516.1 hypothetical protein [Acetobacter sacchari]GBQ99194.1 hypothetical protein AA23498_3434 [Acetobacter nitrogenifigens DSM 23921 = NBRC 105050]GEN61509.1 hypothetical protein ANI02nite_33930 [Acetobacter nitrogenifigens DSM 23921 = NBRC 105050]
MPTPRKFGARPRKHPYSIPRRELDPAALRASHRVPADLGRQVRTSSGMTIIRVGRMRRMRAL